MNKLIFFISICLCLAMNLLAQEENLPQRFKAGLILGINLSQLDGDRLAGYNQLGFNTGAEISVVMSERWNMNMEFLFSQKGSNRTLNDDPASVFENIRLNYVEVPLLVNFYDWKFRASAGFSYANLFDYKVITIDGDDTENFNFRSHLFAFIIGVTYMINDHWGANVRWSRELDVQMNSADTDLRGKTLAFRILYIF